MSETEPKGVAVAEKVEPEAQAQHINHVSDGNYSVPWRFATWSFAGTLVGISFGFYAALLGTFPSWNMLGTVIPQTVGANTTFLWAFPTLMFCQSASAIMFGRISDFIGRRWIFIGGNILSFVGFLSCGRADDASTITGLSALVGIGTGIQFMGPFLAIPELVPVRSRFAIVGLSMSLLAPLLAMTPAIVQALVLNTDDGWRWCYSINAIFSIAATILLLISYRPPTSAQLKESSPVNHRLDKKEWVRILVFAFATALATYGLLWGDTVFAWRSAGVITLITVSGLVFLVYVGIQGADPDSSHGRLFLNIPAMSQITIASQSSLILYFMPSTVELVLQIIIGETGMKAAWNQTSYYAGLTGGFILASTLLIRPRFVKWHLAASVTLAMVFLSAQASINSERKTELLAFSALVGIGQGYAMVVSHVSAPMTADKLDMGLVAGILVAFRNLNYSVLNAILFAIFTPRFTSKLKPLVTDAALEAGLPSSSLPLLFETIEDIISSGDVTALFSVPGIGIQVMFAVQEAVVVAGTEAFRFILLLANLYAIPLALIAIGAHNVDGCLTRDVWAVANPVKKGGGVSRVWEDIFRGGRE
ncbi:fungal trichothecene efflux pump [Aspergillus granulosus]|uniref:Fungal trichothecene efflux pump n=1 Tax=Aspergillus granulosus TaxID=176169 RepID=A0ABR4HSE6_9EURO